jgi:hypothetical protein
MKHLNHLLTCAALVKRYHAKNFISFQYELAGQCREQLSRLTSVAYMLMLIETSFQLLDNTSKFVLKIFLDVKRFQKTLSIAHYLTKSDELTFTPKYKFLFSLYEYFCSLYMLRACTVIAVLSACGINNAHVAGTAGIHNGKLYIIYREPAAVNRGRWLPVLRIVGVIMFTRAFTIRSATFH